MKTVSNALNIFPFPKWLSAFIVILYLGSAVYFLAIGNLEQLTFSLFIFGAMTFVFGGLYFMKEYDKKDTRKKG